MYTKIEVPNCHTINFSIKILCNTVRRDNPSQAIEPRHAYSPQFQILCLKSNMERKART